MKKIFEIFSVILLVLLGSFSVFAEEQVAVNNPELPFVKEDRAHCLMRLVNVIENAESKHGRQVSISPLKIVPSKSKQNRYNLIVDSNSYRLNGTWVIDLVEPKPENMSIEAAKAKSKNYQYWFNYYDWNDNCLYTCWAKYCPCNKDKWEQWKLEGKTW